MSLLSSHKLHLDQMGRLELAAVALPLPEFGAGVKLGIIRLLFDLALASRLPFDRDHDTGSGLHDALASGANAGFPFNRR
jgi:hypothetical protein